MPRVIKFRGKDLDGIWRYGSLVHELGEWYIFENKKHRIDGNTIGQYTNLTTKDGKEVFEGDKLRLEKSKNVWVIGWDEERARWSFVYDTGEVMRSFGKEIERRAFVVVGSIHDLLERAKEV